MEFLGCGGVGVFVWMPFEGFFAEGFAQGCGGGFGLGDVEDFVEVGGGGGGVGCCVGFGGGHREVVVKLGVGVEVLRQKSRR